MDLEAYLKKTPTTNEQRAELWDAFEGSSNEDELASKLQAIQIPQHVKAQLWDMKAGGAEKPSEPAPIEGSAAKRFVHGLADTLNPVTMIQGLGDMAGRGLAAIDNKGVIGASVDAAKSAVDAQSRGFVNAWDLAGQGRTTEALGQAVSGALPVLGPMARDLGEEAAQTGDLATAMGRGVGLGVAPRVISNAPGVVGAVAKPVAAAAVKAAPALAAGAGTAALAGIAGASAPAAILAGLTGAIAEKVILPGKLAAAQRLISWLKGEGAAATPAEIAAKAEKAGLAEELKALRQESAVENKATRAEIKRQKVMAQMDARRASKEAKSAPEPAQATAQAPEAPPAPVEAPPAPVKAESSVHPGYQALVDAVKGKTQAEALKILAEQEVSSFLAPGILERAGVKPVGDVVTRPHSGQRSPAFVDERLKYLQDQAAKRGTAPEEFKAKVAENKTKGAELAAALDEAPKPTARQQGEALHAKAKARGKAKESSGTVGFPPIVKAMSDAVEGSLQAGRNKISNVKVKLSPDGSHEVFTFDLDGVPHSAPLKGKTAQALYRQGYLPGNAELDTKIANGLVLDKVAKPVRSKE